MADKWRPFVVNLLQAGAAIVVTSVTDNSILRIMATVLLVFYLPGAALLRALRIPPKSFPEQQALAIGASIALTIICGLVINTVATLTPLSWIIALTAVLLTLSFIGVSRKAVDNRAGWPRMSLRTVNTRAIGLAMVAILVTSAAFAISVYGQQSYRPFRFTDFWIVRDRMAGPDAIIVGVKSEETVSQNFDVEVWTGNQLIAVWQSIRLDPGHSFIAHVLVPAGSGSAHKIHAWLFRDVDKTYIYRKVSILIDH